MHKNTREEKMSKVGKTNNSNKPDEKKRKIEDVQQFVATFENFKFHDFVKLNRKNSTNQVVKNSLEKLKNIAKEG